MKRTQQEILERFEKANDPFGTQQGDLIDYMDFETARQFLKEDYIKQVESGTAQWEKQTDAKKEILEYLDFAYEKAEGERGLSAARSMLHFKTWTWLDDPTFYDEIIGDIENYTDYGLPTLDKIAKHYGFTRL